MEPVATSNSVAIGFWFPVGSRDEQDGFNGATHFLEHLLFKGTSTKTSRDIALFFDRIGGYINAFTEREAMCVMCVVPAVMAEQAIDVIIEMIYESALTTDDIDTERNVIISEIMAVNDDPEENGMEMALSLMYGHHPVARPITGTIADIRAVTPGKLRQWYKERILTVPPVVTIAGNFEPGLIEKHICGIQTDTTVPVKTGGPVPEIRPGFQYAVSPFRQSQVFLSWALNDSRTSRDWYSWAIVNAITGDTVSSRLFQVLREKYGLCYSVYSFFTYNRDSSLWCSCVTAPPDKTARAVEQLVQELDKIVYTGIREQEIADAKSHIAGELFLNYDDTEYRMKRLARQVFFNGVTIDLDETVSLIHSLTSTEIHERMRESCSDEAKSTIVYGPAKAVREVRKKWK